MLNSDMPSHTLFVPTSHSGDDGFRWLVAHGHELSNDKNNKQIHGNYYCIQITPVT